MKRRILHNEKEKTYSIGLDERLSELKCNLFASEASYNFPNIFLYNKPIGGPKIFFYEKLKICF